MLTSVRAVIVDEIHALARDKRGSHLALSLARLDKLCAQKPQRVGISATQRPMDAMAQFLVGKGQPCTIWDVGHFRDLQLGLNVPETALGAVCSNDQWEQVYNQIVKLVENHRSTLIFVNTRRMAERVAFRLRDRLGEDRVASHHGSMAKERRLAAEEALKSGALKAIVATASLELGIDIGFIDLVIQIGSPRSIAVFLQRVGRSGHAVGKKPHGELFALTWEEAVESLALIQAVRAGYLDRILVPKAPLDILCQQLVAEISLGECDEKELYECFIQAGPYQDLSWHTYDACLELLANGYAEGQRDRAWIVRDKIHRKLRAKRGANLAALNSGGAIPELGEYRVVLEDEKTVIGSVNEDFAIESMVGSIFLLGNGSWQILSIGAGRLLVRDAGNRAPTIPFWEGEAPGRTFELSQEVARLRGELANALGDSAHEGELDEKVVPLVYTKIVAGLGQEESLASWPLQQIVHYVAVQKKALGMVPDLANIVFERFFDEAGGMQLVIHSCYGMRVNRGFGLALRKRFCGSFNFELQASADDNGVVLSLGPGHSFPIETLFSMLNPENIREILVQALLDVPMFQIRWRWNATRSLAVLRSRAGKKVPPPLQRFRADDLLTSAFPMATACLENIMGPIEVPDHLLVQQTIEDCLTEAMDLQGVEELLAKKGSGHVRFIAQDSREPSPFCYQLLNAHPYAFLDDAPLQERRARAVATRRTLSPGQMQELASLDPAAIAAVVQDAWPLVRDVEECFTALLDFVAIPLSLVRNWQQYIDELVISGRAYVVARADDTFVFAMENLPLIESLLGVKLGLALPESLRREVSPEEACLELVRGYLNCSGPVTMQELSLIVPGEETSGIIAMAVAKLELAGVILRGSFRPGKSAEVCNRRLLARIHHMTLQGLRQQIQAVDVARYVDYLCRRHYLYDAGLSFAKAVDRLQAFEIPAAIWETEVFPGRVVNFREEQLDRVCAEGALVWGRAGRTLAKGLQGLNGTTPIALFWRRDLAGLLPASLERNIATSLPSQRVFDFLAGHGACFPWDIVHETKLLPAQVEQALKELAALGLVSCDSWAGLRAMLIRAPKRAELAGRFYIFPPKFTPLEAEVAAEAWIDLLLARYGVLCRDILKRESLAPPWYMLVRLLRARELRGQLRGGRFISSLSGEQYAHEETITALRQVNETSHWAVISAYDPVNIFAIVPGLLPADKGRLQRLLLQDGKIIGYKQGESIKILVEASGQTLDIWHRALRLQAKVRRTVLRL